LRVEPENPEVSPVVSESYFRISTTNDIAVTGILEPVHLKDYPTGTGLNIKVIGRITN
jgi:hypothetical protein